MGTNLIVKSFDIGHKSNINAFESDTDNPLIIAGPCAVEELGYFEQSANIMKKYNIKYIRANIFKPRTSPYNFQGLGEAGINFLAKIRSLYNLKTVTEVVDTRHVELLANSTDVFQIGSRNMQNFELLKEVGKTSIPVLLKRGMSSSISEFILAAEYIAREGNTKILLCERGIKTFETETRNTLDISCIPIIKKETRLPIIVDLSHSLGRKEKDIIAPLARASLAAGADGIMVEVHPCPDKALCDNKQQLNFDEFKFLLREINYNNF